MSVTRRQYYGVSKAGETTADRKELKSPISRELAFEKGSEGWRNMAGRGGGGDLTSRTRHVCRTTGIRFPPHMWVSLIREPE